MAVLVVRVRSLLTRHPSIYWAGVAVIVAITASAVWSATGRLDDARRSWERTRTVWVAAHDIAAGSPLVVARRELPLVAIPDAAIEAEPLGRTATQRLAQGEIVTSFDVGDGLLAAAPDGWQAIAVPTDPARLPAVAGDHVAVYSLGERLAADGLVLDVLDGIVTVAVPVDAAGAVSVAARDQTAVLALRHP